MTEEELRREEFVEERIAILIESGMHELEAIRLARKLWILWDQEMALRAPENAQERTEERN